MRARAIPALDQGETLIEVLVSLVILGIAVVAIVGAMTTSVEVSDTHRKEATASATVRDYAESIESIVNNGGYVAGPGAYPAYDAPASFVASMTLKQCWTGSSWTGCDRGNDIGLQQLSLQVASSDRRAIEKVTIVVRKPCAPGQPTCT